MYVYKLSEGQYEYQCDVLLSHENCFLQDEFRAIVIGAINYNKKHNDDGFNSVFEIKEILIKIYGFKDYRLPIQACIWDEWSISKIANR